MVGWFEVPVTDLERARDFYEKVLEVEIGLHDLGVLQMGWFPSDPGKPGSPGALVLHPDFYQPSDSKGVLVYFTCADVAHALDRVEQAGGKVVQPKTQISEEHGYMGLFIDSEGNRMALHSRA